MSAGAKSHARGDQLLSAGSRFAGAPGWFARGMAPGFQAMVKAVDRGLERGSMLAHLPDGTVRLLGGRAPGFDAVITLKDWRALLRLATNGSIGWYQAYEAGEWECEDMVALFAVMGDNARTLGSTARSTGPFKWAARIAHRLNRNNREGAARNVAAHYDLGNDFYGAWLDQTMSYSSARFQADHGPQQCQQMADPLHYGQIAKICTIANRIADARGGNVLEIGCGWGQLAGHLSEQLDVHVDAISLSEQQLGYAFLRNEELRGTTSYGDIDYIMRDYRDVCASYDAIVSVEMVEALGREYWPHFMDCLERNLKPGGRAALQYISMADDLFETYASSADFIQAYVFPGGLLIKTGEFRALAEARGLEWRDQTDFGLDYAETLRLWRQRFDEAAEEGRLPTGFDDRFVQLWRYYLAYCEAGFRCHNVNVHQVTLVKPDN